MARVLVIDDEADVVRHIVAILTSRGHTVQVARDGASALTCAACDVPDVIILDSDLPKIDGAEVCRRLKADVVTEAIPVVLMTSSYIDLDDVRSQGGPDAYVVRPFVHEVLLNVVDHALADSADSGLHSG